VRPGTPLKSKARPADPLTLVPPPARGTDCGEDDMRNALGSRITRGLLAGLLLLGLATACTPDALRASLFSDTVNLLVNGFGDTADAICECRLNDPGDPGAEVACDPDNQEAAEFALAACLQDFVDNEPEAQDAIACAIDIYDAYLACVTNVLCDPTGLAACADDLDNQLASCGAVIGVDTCF
jgi:hypothetical protein